MGLLKLSYFVTLTFLAWVGLTTILPNFCNTDPSKSKLLNYDGYLQSAYYNSINTPAIVENNLVNSHIVLITAHPDDESMFFTPSLTELSKGNYNNKIHLICLSNGGYEGLGNIRERELHNAAKLLSIETVRVLDFKDDLKVYWDTDEIKESIDEELRSLKKQYGIKSKREIVFLTFDEDGVSGHPNHMSIHKAAKEYAQAKHIRAYYLKSWNLFVKYSNLFITSIELACRWLTKSETIRAKLANYNIDLSQILLLGENHSQSIRIYSDLNSLFLNFSTMTWSHYSQIVWFRWIWIFSSKYMNSNELVPM